MSKLTSKARKALPESDFAGPGESYPIEDESHARNALARVSEYGSPGLQERVRARVKARYPDIKVE